MTQQFVFFLAILFLTFQTTFQSPPIVRCLEANALEFTAPEEILESEILDTTFDHVDCGERLVCKLDCEKILPRAPEGCSKKTKNFYLDLTKLVNEKKGKSLYDKVCYSKRGLKKLDKNYENVIYSIGSQLYRKFVEKETGISRLQYLKNKYPLVYNTFPEIMTNYVDEETFKNSPKNVRESVINLYKNLNMDYASYASDKVKKTYKKGIILRALSEYVDSFRGVIKLCDQKLSDLPESQIESTVTSKVYQNLQKWIKETKKEGAWGFYIYDNLKIKQREEFKRMAAVLNGEFIDIVVKDYNDHIKVNRSYCFCSSFRSFQSSALNKHKNVKKFVASEQEFNRVKAFSNSLLAICRSLCK
jgi:hypothetical protein